MDVFEHLREELNALPTWFWENEDAVEDIVADVEALGPILSKYVARYMLKRVIPELWGYVEAFRSHE